jgi:uncharacterized membrane protein
MAFNEFFKKWQGAILSASIILNVFLIGFMAARLGGPQPHTTSSPPVNFEMRTLPKGLSSEAREQIEEKMRQHQEEVGIAYERLNEVQEEINKMVLENDFNADELERSIREMQQLEQQIKRPMQRAFIDVMRNVDRESRRVIVRERRAQTRDKMRRPNRVDGSSWSFTTEGGRFKLEMDDLKDNKMLEGLRGLEKLEGLGAIGALGEFDNLDELSDLENFEIIITREKGDNGKDAVRFIIIDKDTDEVVEEETVFGDDKN